MSKVAANQRWSFALKDPEPKERGECVRLAQLMGVHVNTVSLAFNGGMQIGEAFMAAWAGINDGKRWEDLFVLRQPGNVTQAQQALGGIEHGAPRPRATGQRIPNTWTEAQAMGYKAEDGQIRVNVAVPVACPKWGKTPALKVNDQIPIIGFVPDDAGLLLFSATRHSWAQELLTDLQAHWNVDLTKINWKPGSEPSESGRVCPDRYFRQIEVH